MQEMTVHISSSGGMQAYMRESLAYSCLRPDVRARWVDYALQAWYMPLLRAGLTNVPFHVVLDAGGRAALPRNPFVSRRDASPDAAVFHRYARALDRFCREAGIRDVMADITLHPHAGGVTAFLLQTLLPISVDTPTLVVIEEDILDEPGTRAIDEAPIRPQARKYHAVIASFVDAFSAHVFQHAAARPTLLADTDRLIVSGAALRDRATAYLDLELVDRCLTMDDPPPLEADRQEDILQALHKLRLEVPLTRSGRPEGGFVGIRNNGGIEEMGNPVISEWANPPPVLREKLINKRLLIYERAASTITVRNALLHVTLIPHSRLYQIDAAGRLPYREAKYLMAAVARDLAAYLCRIGSIETRLNLQIGSQRMADEPVRSMTLSDLPPERLRAPSHFLLDHRAVFPWFFSSDLTDAPAFEPAGTTEIREEDDHEALFDLAEEVIPERDLPGAEHVAGFENVHVIVVCTEEHYRTGRERMMTHLRNLLDLRPVGLDSLIFLVFPEYADSSSPVWALDLVERYHREAGGLHAAGWNAPMPAMEIRDRIRRYFLTRLLGGRFRRMPPAAGARTKHP